MEYLKSESYYSDLYDRFTVERCRRWESEEGRISLASIEDKDPKGQDFNKVYMEHIIIPTALYFIKGEEYEKKEKTIRGWMERDRAKDELHESAKAPEGIRCLTCKSIVKPTFKDLHDWGSDGKGRVLFMYDCPNGCLPHRAFFHDGGEWKPKRDVCPKCSAELKVEMKDTETIFTTIFKCPKCGYGKIDEVERPSAKQEKEDENFTKDRARFCLTEEEGRAYVESKSQLEKVTSSVAQLQEEEKNKDIYEKARALKKLTVVQIQKLLAPALEQQGYINLSFKEPQLSREVTVEFAVQESRGDRHEYDSRMQLGKLIQKTLEDTTWRLMSDGVSYRLGILTGRLRAYEKDEDLVRLVIPLTKQKNNAKTP